MPALPHEFTELLKTTTLPLDDESSESLEALSTAQLRVVADQAVNVLAHGWGAVLVHLGVERSRIPAPVTALQLQQDPAFAAVLAGQARVTNTTRDRDLVRPVQAALQAIAGRVPGAPAALALPAWGVDGSFGSETQAAITALQTWRGLVGTPGEFAEAEATAVLQVLHSAPPPNLFSAHLVGPTAELPSQHSPAIARIIAIAKGLASAIERPFELTVQGKRYSYMADHFGVLPTFTGMLRAPGGYAYSVRPGAEYWKCNIFAGTVLALAEVPVPGHRVGQYRHFPRAERFGDQLASSHGWTMLYHLDHRDPANPEVAIVGEAQDQQIQAMLADVRPGDVCFADNPGPPGSDGGHARVCLAAADPSDPDMAPQFAQARYSGGLIQRDGMLRLGQGRQIQFWLLRYAG